MTTLAGWLRAQLDEDERLARAATGGGPWRMEGMSIRGATWRTGSDALVVKHTWPQEAAHIVRHDPARVLAEIEAKRWLLDEIVMELADDGENEMVQQRLRHLAVPYAGQLGYDEGWRP